MIKQLQRSFMTTALLSMSAVLFVVVAVINGVSWVQTSSRLSEVATMIAQNSGQIPQVSPGNRGPEDGRQGFRPDDAMATRYAAVQVVNGTIQTADTSHILELSQEDAQTMATTVMQSTATSGWIASYRFAQTTANDGTQWIVFVLAQREVENAYRLLLITVTTFVGCMIIVAVLVWYFSKRAVQPFVDNIRRQQEFISNASHEIKTPLAVLSANNDLLTMSGGENKWTTSNKRQLKRLSELVEQMLLLSRFDEGGSTLEKTEFSIQSLLEELRQEFQPLLEEQHICLNTNILAEQKIRAHRDSVKQLVQILLENAIKYTTDASIDLVLDSGGIRVINACEPMTKEQVSHLFERFYRVESSRNRKLGGSGMGLAIAKGIATANHLQLQAKLLDETHLSFVVKFPK